jgi:phosphatidylserine decarboxylase
MSFLDDAQIALQHLLPGHVLSRMVGRLAYCEIPQVKNWLIAQFIKRFDIDMDEVAEPSLDAYPHFNAFFTRTLKDGIRPLAGPGQIASPVDGTIFSSGQVSEDTRLTAKGHHFSVSELLGSTENTATYANGRYVTIYLSPKDYHRVHCPMDAELKHMTYVPGRLFSVNEKTTTRIPAVFARNERVILHFKGAEGPFVLVLVGAMLVASIATPFSGVITPPGREITHWQYYSGKHLKFKQGDEVGRFQYGSTVILLIPEDGPQFARDMDDNQPVQFGQSLGPHMQPE